MHQHLRARLLIDDVRVCYHDDADGCACRKPRPGLLLSAAHDWGIDLPSSYMVGDRWRDVEAGRRAGCTTILIDQGGGEPIRSEPTVRLDSMLSVSRWIGERAGGLPRDPNPRRPARPASGSV